MRRFVFVVFAVVFGGQALCADGSAASEKKLYLPEKIWMVAEGNDYDKEESDYCYKRMVEGDNVAIFWHKEYGDDPMANEDKGRRFDVVVDFKGIADAEGYSHIKTDKAGWRYGFVASLKDGKRVYSDACNKSQGTLSFGVPAETEYLWLVVMGAPTEHWETVLRWNDKKAENLDAQWPYQIKLTGTSVDDSVIK
jgi:hypothetical protein